VLGENRSGGDYCATEAHCLSLAGRIAAALGTGAGLVLLAGDMPAGSQPLSRALRETLGSHRTIIEISCQPDLALPELSPVEAWFAALPASRSELTVSETETSDAVPPLVVFDNVDRLSEQQIREVFEAAQFRACKDAAVLLLAGRDFLTRLEEPSMQFLKEGLAAQFGFGEIGPDESIEFLRHQLAARERDKKPRRIPPALLRGVAASGVLVTLGVGAFFLLHDSDFPGEPSAASLAAISSLRETSEPRSKPSKTDAIKTEAIPTRAAALYPEASAFAAAPAPEPEIPKGTSPAALFPPKDAPPNQPPSSPEIAALVSRGDGFLSAGDVASARLFYERAADAGDGPAAVRLGATFDPSFLGSAGVRKSAGDTARALSWYRRARELGSPAPEEWLKALEQQQLTEPNSPPH
jgi:hypothetical protein